MIVSTDSKIKLSIVIMATRDREKNAELLASQLGCQVQYDEERAGPWANAKKCWEGVEDGATHRVVIQDDAKLCRGFADILPLAVGAHPDQVIGLWACCPDVRVARSVGAPFFYQNSYMSGLGLVMPVDQIDPFIKFRKKYVRADYTSSDAPLMMWLLSQGRGAHFTVPSLLWHMEAFHSFWHAEASNATRRQTPFFADQEKKPDRLLSPDYWGRDGCIGRLRPKRYISVCCPVLSRDTYWPPGGKPDPYYIEAKNRPIPKHQERRLIKNRDQWRSMTGDPDD